MGRSAIWSSMGVIKHVRAFGFPTCHWNSSQGNEIPTSIMGWPYLCFSCSLLVSPTCPWCMHAWLHETFQPSHPVMLTTVPPFVPQYTHHHAHFLMPYIHLNCHLSSPIIMSILLYFQWPHRSFPFHQPIPTKSYPLPTRGCAPIYPFHVNVHHHNFHIHHHTHVPYLPYLYLSFINPNQPAH